MFKQCTDVNLLHGKSTFFCYSTFTGTVIVVLRICEISLPKRKNKIKSAAIIVFDASRLNLFCSHLKLNQKEIKHLSLTANKIAVFFVLFCTLEVHKEQNFQKDMHVK